MMRFAYLQLPYDALVEIFCSRICAQCDQITAVDVFFSQADFAILGSLHPFTLQPPGFTLGSCLAVFKWGIWISGSTGSISAGTRHHGEGGHVAA